MPSQWQLIKNKNSNNNKWFEMELFVKQKLIGGSISITLTALKCRQWLFHNFFFLFSQLKAKHNKCNAILKETGC